MARLIDGFNLFLSTTSLEKQGILSALPENSPVAAALRGDKTFKIGHLELPIMPRGLAQFQPALGTLTTVEGVESGVCLRLPADMALLVSSQVQVEVEKMPNFNFNTLLKTYQFHMSDIVAWLIQEWVKETHRDGLQGLAQTDIRLAKHQIGMAPKTLARFQAVLAQTRPEIGRLSSIKGIWVLNERFPVAGPESVRSVQLVCLSGVEEKFIYMNPEVWNDLQGGDSDGDQSFAAEDGVKFTPVTNIGDFPRFSNFEGFSA